MKYYRSVFVSDLHLGSKHSDIAKLLQFLKETECDYLFFVGDTIDGWELKRKWRWDEKNNVLIQKVLRKSRKGTEVVVIIGNHDDFLMDFKGHRLGNITILRDYVHTLKNNEQCLVIHGDQFDGIISYVKILQHLGSHLYDVLLDLNSWVNRIMNRFGRHYSFATEIKRNTKEAVNFVSKFEECVAQAAIDNGARFVVCGHVHSPVHRLVGNNRVQYLNCGSWQENEFHAVVETEHGTLELITL